MAQSVGQMFFARVAASQDVVALHAPHHNPPIKLTYGDFGKKVKHFAGGLLKLGLEKGDKVALISDNCPQWIISDLAILCVGGISVPRGADTSVAEVWYIINHSEAKGAILQNKRQYVQLAKELSTIPTLQWIVLLDDSVETIVQEQSFVSPGIQLVNYSDVCNSGEACEELVEEAVKQVDREDIAALVYTSGTTGIPKGVPLRHRNLLYQCETIDLGFTINPGDVLLSILPAWHVYERIAEYFGMYHGTTIYYTDKRWLKDDMAKVDPSFIPCVPRIWESVYDAVMAKLSKAAPRKRQLVEFLLKSSREFIVHRRRVLGKEAAKYPPSRKESLKAFLRMIPLLPLHFFAEFLVYRKIRSLTGKRLKAAVSGGGTLAPYLDDFFEAVGVPILNGYGLTETSPVLAVRSVKNNIRGSVGLPLRGTEIEIRDEDGNVLPQGEVGVIWARGPQVMSGYYKNEEETRRVLGPDGWFNTGDLGWFTWQGHLVISGRAKDTIVLLSGENVEPERIETVARKSPLVHQIVVVGQDKKALGALVVPEWETLALVLDLPPNTPIEVLLNNPNAAKVVKDSINTVLREDGGFRSFEFISNVHLLAEPFSVENGMLTQTMKPKRNVILSRYARTIDEMLS